MGTRVPWYNFLAVKDRSDSIDRNFRRGTIVLVNMEINDDSLIDQIRAGKKDALVQYAHNKRSNLLVVIQKSMSGSLQQKIDPQDIFQETIIHALNGFPAANLNQISPFTWLCRLADQRIIDAHRHFFKTGKRSANMEVDLYNARSSEKSSAFIDILVASITTPTQFIAREERVRALLVQFEMLSSDIREAVRLRYVDGLSSHEIATRIGKSEGAIRVMLSRGVKKLRESVE